MLNEILVSSVKIQNYRNYRLARTELQKGNIVYGLNGSGKTNFLEALSFFSPGKGLRGVNLEETLNPQAPNLTVEAEVLSTFGRNHLKLSFQKTSADLSPSDSYWNNTAPPAATNSIKKYVEIDGKLIKSFNQLNEHILPLWFTPKMDTIFLEDSQTQRSFFDRLIYYLDPNHLSRLNSYQKALKERNTLLKQRSPNQAWFQSLEQIMAEQGVCIIASRIDFINKVNQVISASEHDYLSPLTIKVAGSIENLLEEDKMSALYCENLIKEKLEATRAQDFNSGFTNLNLIRSSFIIHHSANNLLARQCSTGEQKHLLITLMMAFIYVLIYQQQQTPLLLLDEILAHLDVNLRAKVLNHLLALPVQFIITSTEVQDFFDHKKYLNFLHVKNNSIQAETL